MLLGSLITASTTEAQVDMADCAALSDPSNCSTVKRLEAADIKLAVPSTTDESASPTNGTTCSGFADRRAEVDNADTPDLPSRAFEAP
jgi:hypothetical protein